MKPDRVLRCVRRRPSRPLHQEPGSSPSDPSAAAAKQAARAAKQAAAAERARREEFFAQAARHTPYVAVEVDRMTFVVATWDRLGGGLFSERRRSEMETLAGALSLLERLELVGTDLASRTFIDVGANIGTTTVTALLRHGFGRALSIEAEPNNLRLLRLNVVANDLIERVRTVGCAVADSEGETELVVYGDSSGKHRIGTARDGQDTIVVRRRTLDAVLAEHDLDPADIGLLWIDTQGHEGHVLAGAHRTLRGGAPLVAEVAPSYLRRSGGLPFLAIALAEHYTHFIDLRAPLTAGGDPDLIEVHELERLVEDYRTRSTGRVTDILAVRLPG